MSARNLRRLFTEAFTSSDKIDLASGEVISFLPEVDDQGAINIGDGTNDMDLKIFLGSTTEYVEFDVGASKLTLFGIPLSIDGDIDLSDGGVVTQITTAATTVVLNTHSGQITTVTQNIAAAGEVQFTVTNSKVAATDIVIVNVASGTVGGTTIASVTAVAAGSFQITLTNLHASVAETGVLVLNFGVLGGSAS